MHLTTNKDNENENTGERRNSSGRDAATAIAGNSSLQWLLVTVCMVSFASYFFNSYGVRNFIHFLLETLQKMATMGGA